MWTLCCLFETLAVMESVKKAKIQLAKNVRMWRAAARLTQEELADAATLERSQISLIEREAANPSLKTLCQLADALQVPLSQLLAE